MEASSAEHVLERPSSPPQKDLAVLTLSDVARLQDQIMPLLERACEYSAGECVPDTVLHGLGMYDGNVRMHMLAMGDAERGITSIMICSVGVYPHKTPEGMRLAYKLDCLLTSGEDVKEWMPFEPRMDAWARSLGCVAVRIPRARRGWARLLTHWRRLSGDCCVLEREI